MAVNERCQQTDIREGGGGSRRHEFSAKGSFPQTSSLTHFFEFKGNPQAVPVKREYS